MNVHPARINDYPFAGRSYHSLRPLELVQLYADNGGDNPRLVDAVTRLDPLYVKFRELDIMDEKIRVIRNRLDRCAATLSGIRPEHLLKCLELQQVISGVKRDLVMGVNDEELTEGRRSLLQIALFLERKGCIETIL